MKSKDPTIEIPTGLSKLGRKAAHCILETMGAKDIEKSGFTTGGCKLFYSSKEWRERGESYGRNSILVVVHDGGDAFNWFNQDGGCFALTDKMDEELGKIGCYAEPCTGWYTAVYAV